MLYIYAFISRSLNLHLEGGGSSILVDALLVVFDDSDDGLSNFQLEEGRNVGVLELREEEWQCLEVAERGGNLLHQRSNH